MCGENSSTNKVNLQDNRHQTCHSLHLELARGESKMKKLTTAVAIILSPATVPTVSYAKLSGDQVRQLLYLLGKAKPDAFEEAQKCLGTDTDPARLSFCVIRSLQISPEVETPSGMSEEQRMLTEFAMIQARGALVDCLHRQGVGITEQAWADCHNNPLGE
jgi:hypothetical protein